MSNGRRQPSRGGTSRMTRECQVRICERLGVKFPGPTRQNAKSRSQSCMSASRRSRHWSHPLAKLVAVPQMAERQCEAVNRIVSGERIFLVELRGLPRISEAVAPGGAPVCPPLASTDNRHAMRGRLTAVRRAKLVTGVTALPR
jgi:hypothetical protein